MSDSVGSVSVDVVPDARGWSAKLRAQLRDQTVTVNADADTSAAEAQLDEVARTRTAKVKADTSQLSQGASKLDQFVGQLGLLPALALTAGAALVPLGAALGGVVAALAAPLLIAGGGATLFGFLAGFAVKQTNEQLKNITTLDKKLSGLTKGTKEYRQTAKELADAQKALTPAQTQFASSLDKVKGSFQGLLAGKNGQALLGPLSVGLGLLARVLPLLEPIIRSVSGAFTTLLGELDTAVSGPGFARFIRQLAREVGPDLVTFGHIAGNGIKGLTGFLTAIDTNLSGGVLRGLERLSENFATLGQNVGKSKAFQDFIDYFHRVGPQVGDTLGTLARTFGRIVEALAPLGPPTLRVIKGIADAFNSIPIPVLTGIAAATAGLVGFQKVGGFKATGLLTNKLTGGQGVIGGLIGGAKPVPVFVTNPGFGGEGGFLGGKGKGIGGLGTFAGLGTLGTVGAGTAAIGGLDIGSQAVFDKIYGKTIGGIGGDITRSVLGGLPDPSTFGMQSKLYGSILGGHNPLDVLNSKVNVTTKAVVPEVHLKSSTNALDGLVAGAAKASRSLDAIGPHASVSSAVASRAIGALQSKLNSIHDVKFAVIAQTAAAEANLRRLQAMQVADKSFTVYQRNQVIERTPGIGGGIGIHPSASGGSGGGASAGRSTFHLHLDDSGHRALTGYVDDRFQANAAADRAYDDARFGR